MALQQQIYGTQGQVPKVSMALLLPQPRCSREITSPLSWAICFMTYVAIRNRDMTKCAYLAYGHLLLQEALKHGGTGYMDNDHLFRKQVAINPTLP